MEIFEKLECLNGVDTDLNHIQRENYLLFCSNIKRCVGKEGTVDMFKRLFLQSTWVTCTMLAMLQL